MDLTEDSTDTAMQQQHFNRMMLTSGLLAVVVCCCMLSEMATASVISCPPNGVQQELSPKLNQLCSAIEQILSDTQQDSYPPARLIEERNANLNAKRQDVDHVFLRFGRRMGL